jgi:outer membrane protein assembly factor BamB
MAEWPSFRGGPWNTGRSPAPLLLQVKKDTAGVGSVRVGGLIWGTPVVHGSSVFVGSTNRRFVRIDLTHESPSIAWTYAISGERADSLIDSAACLFPRGGGRGGTDPGVVVPGGDGALHALDAATGAVLWRFHASGATDDQHSLGVVVNSFEGNVQVSPDGALLYAGNDNGRVYCVDARTGGLVWTYALPSANMVWTAPAYVRLSSRSTDVVVFGSLDGHVYVLGARDGVPHAPRYDTGAEIKSTPAVLQDADGLGVFVCNSNGDVVRLGLSAAGSDVTAVWRASHLDGEIYASPTVDAAGGAVVVANMRGTVAGLSAHDGALLWRVDMGRHAYTTSSPVLSADRILVLGNSNGRLLALDARDGRLLGCRALSPSNLNSSPVLLPDGTVVVGSYDGRVYFVPAGALLGSEDAFSDVDPTQTLQPTNASASEPIRSFRFNGSTASEPDDDDSMRAVNPATVRVRPSDANTNLPYEIVVSPEGSHVNFVPSIDLLVGGGPSASRGVARVGVSGTHYALTDSWLKDRLRSSSGEVGFRAAVDLPPLLRSPALPRFSDLYSKFASGGALRVDLHRLSASQPAILDTYIPAAIAGIGYVCWITAVRGVATHGTFVALFLPAVPEEEDCDRPFRVLHEPSKVQCHRAVRRGLF